MGESEFKTPDVLLPWQAQALGSNLACEAPKDG